MSLYIRTKMFQILEVTKKEEDTSFKDVSYWYKCKRNRYKMNGMHSDFVIKESENLEDLMDKFIARYNDEDNNDYSPNFEEDYFDLLEVEMKKYKADKKDFDIYGGIWTPRGLNYVVKLNEKGEWELI